MNTLIIVAWVPSCKALHASDAAGMPECCMCNEKQTHRWCHRLEGFERVTHLLQASHEALLQFLQALLLVHPPVTPLQASPAPDNRSFVGLVPCWGLLPEKREAIMQITGEMDVP